MSIVAPTPNGAPAYQPSQPTAAGANPQANQPAQPSQGATTSPPSTQTPQQSSQQAQSQPQQPEGAYPRPRDSRTMELLLTAQGVQAYEPRVPLLLLDFAYRHTSSILSDALHLAQDPNYLTKSGGTGGGGGGIGDPVVKASAVQTAIISRLAYQFRGGGGAAGGGGASKDWMLSIARERNKVALPRINANEWGIRLPTEKFVLSGVNWGLKEMWAPNGGEEGSEEEEEEEVDRIEDVLRQGNGDGKDVEMEDAQDEDEEGGGTYEDVFGKDTDGDATMG